MVAVSICLPDGSRELLTYDQRGNILTIEDSEGNVSRFDYDNLNRVIKATDPNGNIMTFKYNAKGDITKATNAEGNSRVYEYNNMGKVTKITNYDGGMTSHHYNEAGYLDEITNPAGQSTKFSYDLMGKITEIVDLLGNKVLYRYDQFGNIIKITDQEGYVTQYENDKKGNVTAIVSPLGARTEILYDALDRKREIREADGAVTQYFYDNLGNLNKIMDPLGGETVIRYNSIRQVETVIDPLGNTTTYTYSALGKVETVTDSLGGKQVYQYYPGGKLKSVTFPNGEVREYAYDRNGNIIKLTDGLGQSTVFQYNCLNHVVSITDPLGNTKKIDYNVSGNIAAVTDENDNTTSYQYSPTGEVTQMTDAMGYHTHYGYDIAGRLVRLEQNRYVNDNIIPEIQVTTWEYNHQGKVTRVRNPLNENSYFQYDANGNLISKIDEEGNETRYEYNMVNMVSKVLYADGKTVELSYGQLRQLNKIRDWLGITAIESDSLGRTVKVTDHNGKSIQYEWNPLSQRTGIIYPDGSRVGYHYNAAGQLEEITSDSGKIQYRYDTVGRIIERLLPGDIRTLYSHDPLGRLTELTHQQNGEISDRFRYIYDPVGNITEIDKYRLGVEDDNGKFYYHYDPLGRLTEAVGRNESHIYQYDSLGNRTRSIYDGISTIYHYNARNQLIRSQTGDDLTEYRYEARGNLTHKLKNGVLEGQYIFDATNRMTGAIMADIGKTEYIYNGFLRRVKKRDMLQEISQEITHETDYILDLTKPYNDLLSVEGPKNQRFVWSHELLMTEGGNRYTYLCDHLGSPVRLKGNSQEELLAYDEFGINTVRPDDSSFGDHFGFTGEYMDFETDTIYLRARNYAPAIGRFLSEDFVHDRLNWYAYCDNNPLVYTDPSGCVIQLIGTEEEKQTVLRNLQSITDYQLSYDTNGIINIEDYTISGDHVKGNELVRKMVINGDHKTRIEVEKGKTSWTIPNTNDALMTTLEKAGKGSGSTILFDTTEGFELPTCDPVTGIVKLAPTPAFIILAHELIHADRCMRGMAISGNNTYSHEYLAGIEEVPFLFFWTRKKKIYKTEYTLKEDLATCGFDYGDYRADDLLITENDIRSECMDANGDKLSMRGAYEIQ